MEAYANALLIAIPSFLLLLIIEILYGHFTGKQTYRVLDTVSSLSSGITNIISDSLGLAIMLVSYPFLLQYLSVFEIENNWIVFVLAFIAIDFAGYWTHRLAHHINYFWNTHIIHHSSEEFNLACALRQSVSNILGYFTLFLIPAAILGIPNEVIALLSPIHLFLQFWYHTKHIGKLGFLEYIIVTPSQHRVHHAINKEYIDKNLAPIFCIWDRIFGTFQEELEEAPPVYGVLKPVRTWNPFLINFQHLWRLMKDAWLTNNWWDKLRIWFKPTGWRPNDVKEKYPIQIIENPYAYEKYNSHPSKALLFWAIFRLITTTIFLLFLLGQFGELNYTDRLLYGVFIFFSIFGYTSAMDKKKYAIIFEFIGVSIGCYAMFSLNGNWFGVNEFGTFWGYLIAFYFLIVLIVSVFFSWSESQSTTSN